MTFRDEDLTAEVEGLFAENQLAHLSAAIHQTLTTSSADGTANSGFRVFTPNPTKTAERKKYLAKWAKQQRERQVREALLSGERPDFTELRQGAPRKVWLKVARELGLPVPPPSTDTRPASVTYRERKIRAAILAGERPASFQGGVVRRPPITWLRIAAELGIDLSVPVARQIGGDGVAA